MKKNDLTPPIGASLPLAALGVVVALIACTPPRQGAPGAPMQSLLLTPGLASATPAAVSASASVAAVRVPAEESASCPLRGWSPHDVHAGVSRIPSATMRSVMAPVIEAACRCTREGDRVGVVAYILPERGEVTADAPDQQDIAGCLAMIPAGRFPPFEVGSDVIGREPPPGWPGRERPKPSSRIVYPVTVDRSGEPTH